jgi:ECF sigma factor
MGIKARAGLTMPSPQNVTEMLRDWRNGDQEALGKLIPVVYDELRHQAARYLRRERPGHTLQTTALIHEAYLRLINH